MTHTHHIGTPFCDRCGRELARTAPGVAPFAFCDDCRRALGFDIENPPEDRP